MNMLIRENCDCNHVAGNNLCPECHTCKYDVTIDNNTYTVFVTTCKDCSDGDRFGWTSHPDNKSPDHSENLIREKATEKLQVTPSLYKTHCNCNSKS